MQWRNSSERFGLLAGLLHWSIVLGVIAQYFLAEAGEDSKAQPGALDAMSLHRSIGFTILALAIVRLIWRLIDAPPRWPDSMRPFERRFAKLIHVAFYALLFAVPLSGWALASAEGDRMSFFGLFTMPPLPVGEAMEHTVEEVHEILFNVLAALGLLHLLAALKHQFVDHDGTLARMLPGRH
jgi:cytochrome b561